MSNDALAYGVAYVMGGIVLAYLVAVVYVSIPPRKRR